MNENLDFFITAMPDTRPADYYLGCSEGSVYIDFDTYKGDQIRLKRISFDRYGCCDLGNQAIPMDEVDSRAFKKIIDSQLIDQALLTILVKKTLSNNKELIWEEALNEYGLS